MRRRCTALHPLLVFLGLCLWAPSSFAQAQPAAVDKSAVVVIDAGTADIFIESLVRSTVEAELEKNGYRIVSGVAVGGDTPARLLACSGDLACAAAIMAGIPSQFVFFLSLRSDLPRETSNFKIVARSFDVGTGRAIARTMRRCESCIEDVALASFTETVVSELLQEVKDPEPTKDLVAPVEPPVEVPDQTQTPSLITIEPTSASDEGAHWLAVGKYASLGLGVTAIATGTVLVLIDGPVVEDGLRQPEANDTLGLGFVSLGTGAALIGLSAWLWSQNDSERAGSIVLSPERGGASAYYGGAF